MSDIVSQETIDAAIAHLKTLYDAGVIDKSTYDARVNFQLDRLYGGAGVAVSPGQPVSMSLLHKHLNGFGTHTIKKQWTTWSKHAARLRGGIPTAGNLWGVQYMYDLYCKSMIQNYLPIAIEPDKDTDPELYARYRSVVLPRFEKKCRKYQMLIEENKDNPAIIHGFDYVVRQKLTKLQAEINNTKTPTRKQLSDEWNLTKLTNDLANWRVTVNRYFNYSNVFLAYLELKNIDIADVYPDDFVEYQGYIDNTHERVTGEPYNANAWNEFRVRTSTFFDYLSAQKDLKSAQLKTKLLSQVPIVKVYQAEQRHPPEAYPMRINDAGEMSKKSGILKLYSCIAGLKNPSLVKNLDLLKLCIRFMRETGLRAEQFSLMKWGRLPKSSAKPVHGLDVPGIYSVDFIGFQDDLPGDLKQVARETMYISKKLAHMILAYRKKYPDRTHDDYYVFSGKIFFNWKPEIGGYRTSMLGAMTYRKNVVTGKRELVKMRSPAYGTIFSTINKVCPKKVGIRIKPTSFRDSFMTLMLETLSSHGTAFKDITGDLETTARKNYRATAGVVVVPKMWHQTLSYAEVVHHIFNREDFD